MKRRLVVHVGTAKAGSTSIQNLLAARSRRLARAGVHVPLAGGGSGLPGAHQGLARELVDPYGAAGNWTRVELEMRRSAAPRFVVSAEAFTGPAHRAKCAERLLGLAAREDLEIDVVGYVRPQWQWLESAYAQQATTGATGESFERFAARLLAAGGRTRLDYNTVFAPFRAAFGDRVRVRPLTPAHLPGGLLADFLGVLGVDPGVGGPAAWSGRNPRPGAKDVEVRRRLCEAAGTALPGLARALRWLPALLVDDAPFAPLADAGIERIRARFAAANERFARDYGIDAQGVLFADDGAGGGRRRNVVRWDELAEAERRRVRRYALDRTGVDPDPAAGDPGGRLAAVRRLALRGPRLAAAPAVGRLATADFRARRAWARRAWARRR